MRRRLAPRRRVPRHRLINNLVDQGRFDEADAEIRLFENEMRADGPVQRYKVQLLLERARKTKGILEEDKKALVIQAANQARSGIARFTDNRKLYEAYLQVGIVSKNIEGTDTMFLAARDAAKDAYDRILDPELDRAIQKYVAIAQRAGVVT